MKVLRSIKMLVALVPTLTFLLTVPLQTVGAVENNGKYVSEVFVAYGKDADAAKKTLEDKGFTPVEGNLNDSGKTYAMMGYKTTDDIRDSVTDIAVMNMNGGYSVENYSDFRKTQKNDIAQFLESFMDVIREYRQNLKNQKTKAVVVHDILNNYTDDDTGMKMGNLLNSETLQDKLGVTESIEAENPDNLPNLATILMQGNAPVICSIETLLTMAADSGETSFIDRLAELDYDALLDKAEDERSDLNTESKRKQYLDNLYEDDATLIAAEMSELRAKINEYKDIYKNAHATNPYEIFGNFLKTRIMQDEYLAMLERDEWMAVASVYEGLKVYTGGNYKKGELLEMFMQDADEDDYEYYYPIVAALSAGQRAGLPFVSLEMLLCYGFSDEEGWTKVAEEKKIDFASPEDISVYEGIDRDLYKDDGTVAMTDAAKRANSVDNLGTKGSEEEQYDLLARITRISWAATGTALVATGMSALIASDFAADAAYLLDNGVRYWDDEILNAIKNADAYKKYTERMTGFGMTNRVKLVSKARFTMILTRVLVVTTIVISVISATLTVIDMLKDRSIEQLPIPKYLVDNYADKNGGSYALNYKAVECNREEYFGADYKIQKGSSADLNADEGKQWIVLYASKNSKAGKPLTPDFVIRESNKAPNGYEGSVHLIGEKGAVNVASPAFKNYSTFSAVWQTIGGDDTKYIFCKCSNISKTYDESAGNMTASSVNNGLIALWGFGGLALGAVLGVVFTILIKKNKKKKETA